MRTAGGEAESCLCVAGSWGLGAVVLGHPPLARAGHTGEVPEHLASPTGGSLAGGMIYPGKQLQGGSPGAGRETRALGARSSRAGRDRAWPAGGPLGRDGRWRREGLSQPWRREVRSCISASRDASIEIGSP